MSTRHIPYPSDFDTDHAAAHQEERRRRALTSLEVGDVLAQIDDLISQEPDPAKHPCFAMVAWMLDHRLEPGHGGAFWDAWKVLAWQASTSSSRPACRGRTRPWTPPRRRPPPWRSPARHPRSRPRSWSKS